MTSDAYLTAEAQPGSRSTGSSWRAGGWCRTARAMNLYASQGVAVREFIMATGPRSGRLPAVRRPQGGRRDRGEAVGHAAGRRRAAVGEVLDGAARRTCRRWSRRCRSCTSRPATRRCSPTGSTPSPRSRPVFTFHRPETLARWLRQWRDDADGGSLRARLQRLDRCRTDGLAPHPGRGDRQGRGVDEARTVRGRWPRWRPGRARRSWPRTSPTGWSSMPTPSGSCSSSTGPTSAARR